LLVKQRLPLNKVKLIGGNCVVESVFILMALHASILFPVFTNHIILHNRKQTLLHQ